jgi:uncharacterized membrane protein
MKTKILFMGFIGLAIALFSSCVTRLGTFTVISTRNIEWNRAGEYQRNSKRVTGDDTAHIIILIPTRANVTIEEAVDNALNQIPGAVALVDVALRYTSFYIPYIYGRMAYIIEGSTLIDPKLANLENDDTSFPYIVFFTNDGKDFSRININKEEYNKYFLSKT